MQYHLRSATLRPVSELLCENAAVDEGGECEDDKHQLERCRLVSLQQRRLDLDNRPMEPLAVPEGKQHDHCGLTYQFIASCWATAI